MKMLSRSSFREAFLLFLLLVLGLQQVLTSETIDETTDETTVETTVETTNEHAADLEVEGHGESSEEHGDFHPFHAVLFPSFILTIGVMVFYILSRFAPALPYTAIMFLIGTFMGVATMSRGDDTRPNDLKESLGAWMSIDSEVLLLVFLPGLIFRDSFGQNVHLFWIALPQLFLFAFPMVLAGTVLTAVFTFYAFSDYGWSFNLAMTVGTILSATDPVAVAALLEEVGAPPRLKVHVAGESLLNDGSAIVFFLIFKDRFLNELGIPGVGEDVDWGSGILKFLQKSLGAVAVGLISGAGLLVLTMMLNHRFNREENVVEVVATFAVAYVGYYVAEIVCSTSGVIATVTTGLVVRFFVSGIINDAKLLDDFWTMVEHLLNTIIFALGGVVWGSVVADGIERQILRPSDLGRLVLLYVFLTVLRGFLFAVFYPVVSRIGLKSSWQEAVFQVHGGLRGAVGIALALFLESEVREEAGTGDFFEEKTSLVFALVGGIAFMTLVINGVTAGPLLRKLGLADSTDARKRIVECYQVRFRAHLIDEFVRLLTQRRFHKINFALIKHHVPQIADLTKSQLLDAVDRHKETTPTEDYHPPHLHRILPYLPADEQGPLSHQSGFMENGQTEDVFNHDRHVRHTQRAKARRTRRHKRRSSTLRFMMGGEPLSAQELRSIFVSLLRAAYAKQIKEGELVARHFLTVALEQSLEFATDAVSNGETLKDWEYVTMADRPITDVALRLKNGAAALGCLKHAWAMRAHTGFKMTAQRLRIDRSLAFMAAHRWAQQYFQKEFQDAGSELSEAGKIVLQESRLQYMKAEKVLDETPEKELQIAVSHKFCTILLSGGIFYVDHLVEIGLLKESEAEHLVEEIEEHLDLVMSCEESQHPGEMDLEVNDQGDSSDSDG